MHFLLVGLCYTTRSIFLDSALSTGTLTSILGFRNLIINTFTKSLSVVGHLPPFQHLICEFSTGNAQHRLAEDWLW